MTILSEGVDYRKAARQQKCRTQDQFCCHANQFHAFISPLDNLEVRHRQKRSAVRRVSIPPSRDHLYRGACAYSSQIAALGAKRNQRRPLAPRDSALLGFTPIVRTPVVYGGLGRGPACVIPRPTRPN